MEMILRRHAAKHGCRFTFSRSIYKPVHATKLHDCCAAHIHTHNNMSSACCSETACLATPTMQSEAEKRGWQVQDLTSLEVVTSNLPSMLRALAPAVSKKELEETAWHDATLKPRCENVERNGKCKKQKKTHTVRKKVPAGRSEKTRRKSDS